MEETKATEQTESIKEAKISESIPLDELKPGQLRIIKRNGKVNLKIWSAKRCVRFREAPKKVSPLVVGPLRGGVGWVKARTNKEKDLKNYEITL